MALSDDEVQTILDRLDPEVKNRIVAESEAASVPLTGSDISSVWLKGKGVSVHIVPKKHGGHNATGSPAERPYRIAFVDIETAPNRGYTWGKWEQNVIAFDQEWYLLCFGVKWAGDERTKVHALPDFAGYDDDRTNDAQLAAKLWEVLDQADLVIAHNGDKFDIKKSNARFLVHGMTPPSPFKTIDTLKVARRHFALNSNKLDDVARVLGLGKKAETGGFQLWLDCMAGDRKAWRKMKRYCGHDVDLLESVYDRLRPWHSTHPNIAIDSSAMACAACGSERVQRRGVTFTGGKQQQRFQCLGCGKWSSAKAA